MLLFINQMEKNMKIYWVFAYDHHYPAGEDFLESFKTEFEATEFIEWHRASVDCIYDVYRVVNVVDRL